MAEKRDILSSKNFTSLKKKLEQSAKTANKQIKALAKAQSDYTKSLMALTAEAKRLGGRIEVTKISKDGLEATIDLTKDPDRLLEIFLGLDPKDPQPRVFVPSPLFCASLGCRLFYTKGNKICSVFGCWVGKGELTCLAWCIDQTLPA